MKQRFRLFSLATPQYSTRPGGLGEFDADGLIRFIEVIGGVAGNDPAYNELVEKLADFVGTRKSEAEGALVLLKRAQRLDLSADKFDMIRWLGKAAIGLTKREYTAELIDATQLLTLAYRSAGLHWAARASCCLAAASIIEGEKDGDLPASIVPTMKIWAWNALDLCRLPDVLFAIQLLNGCLAGLPLTEESKAKVREVQAKLREVEEGVDAGSQHQPDTRSYGFGQLA